MNTNTNNLQRGVVSPGNSNHKFPWNIALVANLKDEFEKDEEDPPDAGAEYDRQETLEAISAALELDGHKVQFLNADETLPIELGKLRPDFVFNIAEGLRGDGREAHIPALCELMGIPYTASKVVANAIALDKTQTKRVWGQLGLPTAPYNHFTSLKEVSHLSLNFPLFVKPSSEGTGMGIDGGAIVKNHKELIERVEWILHFYRQPALVEEYLPGREFTVGFIGNPGNPMYRNRPELYDSDGYHWFPILEIDTLSSVSPLVYGHDAKALDLDEIGAPRYLCPADIPESLHARLIDLTRQAAEALNPSVSDLCIMAAAGGMPYQVLITEILYLAAERYGMLKPVEKMGWFDMVFPQTKSFTLTTKNKYTSR